MSSSLRRVTKTQTQTQTKKTSSSQRQKYRDSSDAGKQARKELPGKSSVGGMTDETIIKRCLNVKKMLEDSDGDHRQPARDVIGIRFSEV